MSSKAEGLAQQLIRNWNHVPLEHQERAPLYESLSASLASGTAAHKLGAGFDSLPPGKRSCPYHFHHAQEEMFVILAGNGSLRVAGELLPITAGDVIFIPAGPEYPHQIINTSAQQLDYLSISTCERPELVEYPDSGKFLAKGIEHAHTATRVIQRAENTLDYWDGED